SSDTSAAARTKTSSSPRLAIDGRRGLTDGTLARDTPVAPDPGASRRRGSAILPTVTAPATPATPDPAVLLAQARQELARLPGVLESLLGGLDDALWRARPAPGEWSPLEIVCHLRDEEEEDFGARLRVVVEGGDRFAPIDPPAWAVERRYADAEPRQALAALGRGRAASLAFLAALAPERLARAVTRPGHGRLSGLDLLAAWVTHDRLHLAQLAATLARTGADRWAPLRAEYAGPLPYGAAPASPA
ncbi:MAG TPA: DinB family protein, partial [Methylomirabilota bacterium]|nr:DinB family protein [Methylomirabilota bacterium]